MLKLHYLTNNTYTEIPFTWPTGYTIKMVPDPNTNTNRPLLTGGNIDNSKRCGGYMVITNGSNDKLYILKNNNLTEITTFLMICR